MEKNYWIEKMPILDEEMPILERQTIHPPENPVRHSKPTLIPQ